MVNIDAIMALLDWNNSAEQQERGIELAKNVKCINVFLQPNQREYGKNVCDNCAKILSERSNTELSPYLVDLMRWLQDMNWPGAFCILERLRRMVRDPLFQSAYTACLKCADALEKQLADNYKRIERYRHTAGIFFVENVPLFRYTITKSGILRSKTEKKQNRRRTWTRRSTANMLRS